MRRGNHRKVAASDAKAYLGKAVQYFEEAQEAFEAKRWSPAVGNAVHAGILGVDAVTATLLGTVWRGEHDQAVRHARQAGDHGKTVARDLHRLLSLKGRAEYDPEPATSDQAEQAVKAAKRIVERAGAVVNSPAPTRDP